MGFLGKEYSCYKHENFEAFLQHVGLPEDKAKALTAAASSQKFEKSGDSYIHTTTGLEGRRETTFKSGVEFDDVIGPNKHPIKSKFTVDGDVVMQTITSDDKGTAVLKREYKGDELLVTITTDGWDGVAKRYYRA